MSQMKCSKKIVISILFFVLPSLMFNSCSAITDDLSESTSEIALSSVSAPVPSPDPIASPTPEPTAEPISVPTSAPVTDPTPAPAAEPVLEVGDDIVVEDEFTYVLNTSTQKIHHPNCKSVGKIKSENYATTDKSLDELLGEGYTKCGNCW